MQEFKKENQIITPEYKNFISRFKIIIKYEYYQLIFGRDRRKKILRLLSSF
jgi:hypothetical protein